MNKIREILIFDSIPLRIIFRKNYNPAETFYYVF